MKCAILDDYQNIALSMANWHTLHKQVELQSYQQHFDNEDELVNAIAAYDIVVIMRERTLFNASVLQRLPR